MGAVRGWRAVVAAGAVAAGAMVVGAAAPASAHVCAAAREAEVGRPLTLTVGVAVDTPVPIVEVELDIPDGFELAQALPADAWQPEVEGDTVRWTGGEAQPGSCAFFTLRGTPTERAVLEMPLRATLVDGTQLESSPTNADGLLPVVVYAGVDPFAADPGDDGGTPAWQAVAGVAGGLAVVGGAAWAVSRRTRRRKVPAAP